MVVRVVRRLGGALVSRLRRPRRLRDLLGQTPGGLPGVRRQRRRCRAVVNSMEIQRKGSRNDQDAGGGMSGRAPRGWSKSGPRHNRLPYQPRSGECRYCGMPGCTDCEPARDLLTRGGLRRQQVEFDTEED